MFECLFNVNRRRVRACCYLLLLGGSAWVCVRERKTIVVVVAFFPFPFSHHVESLLFFRIWDFVQANIRQRQSAHTHNVTCPQGSNRKLSVEATTTMTTTLYKRRRRRVYVWSAIQTLYRYSVCVCVLPGLVLFLFFCRVESSRVEDPTNAPGPAAGAARWKSRRPEAVAP